MGVVCKQYGIMAELGVADACNVPTAVVFQQCNDIVLLQKDTIANLQHRLLEQTGDVSRDDYEMLYRELQSEMAEHAQTRTALGSEREKVQFASTEVDILSKQVQREKATFEQAFGLLKSQALSDCSKAETLLAKCTALEALCGQREDEISSKDAQITELRQRLKDVERLQKQELRELNIKLQQDLYIAKQMNERSTRSSKHKHGK